MKMCSRCGELKPHQEFGKDRVTPDGLKAYCKPCAAAYLREHRQAKSELHREYEQTKRERHGDKLLERDRKRAAARAEHDRATRGRFARKIRKNYGITLDEYDALVSNPCQLCGSTKNVVLDHCHATGAIRAPLCKPCNSALGVFGDDPARLRAAADYIESHRMT